MVTRRAVHARGEEGENPRSWLWVCQNAVRMIVDPSRSAAAAQKLFGGLGRASVSRSAYKKLARELPNHFVLAYCRGAARLPRTPRHEALGKPNRGRSQRQATAAFHGERTNRCTRRNRILRTTLRHSQARQQALAEDAPQRKPLQSLLRHREGLEVYDQPCQWTTTLPNGPCAVPRRKLSFGYRSATGRAALFRAHLAGLSPHPICGFAQNATDSRPRTRMLGFPGVRAVWAVWAVSAPGAPLLRRGHELLWAGLLRGRTRPGTTQRNPPLKRTSLSRVLCERLA